MQKFQVSDEENDLPQRHTLPMVASTLKVARYKTSKTELCVEADRQHHSSETDMKNNIAKT